jgi:hypothetical protein
MEPWPGRPEVCKSADLLAPEGYGEIIGGSERMSDPNLLIQRLQEHGLPMEPYQWYVDLRKYGSVPHSGFGLGVERTVGWICGLEHIREVSPFPRLINRLYPCCSIVMPACPPGIQADENTSLLIRSLPANSSTRLGGPTPAAVQCWHDERKYAGRLTATPRIIRVRLGR